VSDTDSRTDRYEVAVDEAIASCDNSTRGALKALIIANEFLEAEVASLRALRRDLSRSCRAGQAIRAGRRAA
jgi:hypothetical protein